MPHQKAVDAVREDIRQYINLLYLSHEAIICTDEALNIVVYNQGAETLFGYFANEAPGQPLEILIPERYREIHKKHIAEFGRSEEKSKLMNKRQAITGLRKDGKEFTAQASISKFRYGGELTYTVVMQLLAAE